MCRTAGGVLIVVGGVRAGLRRRRRVVSEFISILRCSSMAPPLPTDFGFHFAIARSRSLATKGKTREGMMNLEDESDRPHR